MSVNNDEWSFDEIAILAANYPERGWRWDGWESLLPGRTKRTIQMKASRLGIRQGFRTKRRPRQKVEVKADTYRYREVRSARDPIEKVIAVKLRNGFTPSEIDKTMKWVPGRTKAIMIDCWDNNRPL